MRKMHSMSVFFNEKRIFAWSLMFFVGQIVLSVFIFCGMHGFFGEFQKTEANDFISFYSAGFISRGVYPALAYDQAFLHVTEKNIAGFAFPQVWFFYPPTYLLVCKIFSVFNYGLSFYIFSILGIVSYVLSLVALMKFQKKKVVILLALAFPSTLLCVVIGQNSLMTAAIFGFGFCVFLKNRFWGGVVLGLLSYKPHFGMLLPFAFISGREWRSFIGAALSTSMFVLLSTLFLGWNTWLAYWHVLPLATHVFREGIVPHFQLMSVYGTMLSWGAGYKTSISLQMVSFVLMALSVCCVWYKNIQIEQKLAMIIPATQLSMPVILFYDLVPIVVSGCLLASVRYKSGKRFLVSLFMVFSFPACLLLRGIDMHFKVSLEIIIVFFAWALILYCCLSDNIQFLRGVRRGRTQQRKPDM